MNVIFMGSFPVKVAPFYLLRFKKIVYEDCPHYVCISVFLCEPDSSVFNLQGDKGEAGAAGRDVSFAESRYII